DPALTAEMENFQFKNLPHTFQDGKELRVVRFQTTEGRHCIRKPPNETWKVVGDLRIDPEGFSPIDENDNPNFKDVVIIGTEGTWTFDCCIHGAAMSGSITVQP